MSTKKKSPEKPEAKKVPVDNTARNERFWQVYTALIANPDSPRTEEELISSAHTLTAAGMIAVKKENY